MGIRRAYANSDTLFAFPVPSGHLKEFFLGGGADEAVASQRQAERDIPISGDERVICVDAQGNIIPRRRCDMRELDAWLALSVPSFDFWDNEEDAIYDNL